MSGLPGPGKFLLSIDVELAELTPRYPVCQQIVDALLKLMEKYEIRATWATCGYMFPGRSTRSLGGNPLPRPVGACAWDGKNVVQRIIGCKVSQEIGSHTFSHVRVGDPRCTQDRFESELKECQSAAEEVGVTLQSFVFPWNSVGYFDSLRKYGYLTYRGPSADWFAGLPASLRRPSHLLYHLLLMPPPKTEGVFENGLWNIPASYFYACGAGWKKMIPVSLRVAKARQGLRTAARERTLFHLWFHPFNLAGNPEAWLKGLDNIFADFCRYRDRGLLENPTMGELAHALELQRKKEMIVP